MRCTTWPASAITQPLTGNPHENHRHQSLKHRVAGHRLDLYQNRNRRARPAWLGRGHSSHETARWAISRSSSSDTIRSRFARAGNLLPPQLLARRPDRDQRPLGSGCHAVGHFWKYSNRMRGQRLKQTDAEVVAVPEGEVIDVSVFKPRRIPSKKWRELITKVWEADPHLEMMWD